MKKLKTLLLILVSIGIFTPKGQGQEIQLFGPGVHQDLDHRIETRSICVPNPTKDVAYDFNKSFESNVNAAIGRERTQFKNSKISDYVHPEYYTSPVDYVHKIITALRKAYSGAYDIKVVDIPLDISVTNAAQNHSCKMISCNQFTHQSSCTGSPKSRLEEQVGNWGSCLNGYSENIAINTSQTIEGAIEWAIFGMMYDDLDCCRNGHRENFLKCTYDDNWRMGFGYQKGKYSFGAGRTYDAWFMTWDYAKRVRTSGCSWDKDQKAKSCPAPEAVALQNLKVAGESDCSSLRVTWTSSNYNLVSNFEVYQSIDGKSFTKVATAAPRSDNKYASVFKTSGEEARIFVKANTKTGVFFGSELSEFNVGDCRPQEDEEPEPGTEANSNPEPEVTNTPPPAPVQEPKPEVDPNKLVISPNPAKTYIRLSGVALGSVYRIYTMTGKFAMIGVYRGNIIQISRLKAGTYVLKIGDKAGQFVKI